MGWELGKSIALREAVDEYLIACQAGGLSRATLSAYRYGLIGFRDYFPGEMLLAAVSASDIRRWLAALMGRQSARGKAVSASTVEQCYRSVHTFFVWCVANRLLEADPMAGVRKPKVGREVPNFLSVEEMGRFRDQLLNSRFPERNLAVGMVFLDCGARRKEVAGLAMHDLDLGAGVLTIRRGKGGKGRRVPLSPSTIHALRCWIALRPARLAQSLFGMSGMAIYLMVTRSAARAGVKVSVHGLRHTFATHYDGPLDDLQKILGHASVETTITIYRHRLEAGLVAHHAERSPVGQLARGQQLRLTLPDER